MAAKKIGAIIALDGEKEFKQNVTSCNKSLSSLKSEMQLVKAQCEGQQNSLESLTKQHEVLTKILGEQEKKEEETRKGLEHARESYDKVSKGLETLNRQQDTHIQKLADLQEEYQKATSRLEAMEKAGNSSEQSMIKQQAVVSSLSAAMQKEEAAIEEVNAAINKGNKNLQSAGNRISDWETKLNTAQSQVIKASNAVNKNAAYMKEAEQATDQCATSIDKFGKEVKQAEDITVGFGTVVKTNLTNTVVEGVKNLASSSASAILEMESAQRQFQASTGATTGEMKQYKAVMDEMHSKNYGEDINDLAQSMALVKQYTGELDPSALKEMTEDGIAMRDVFSMDLSETIRGVDALMENMGATSEHAFDLMAKGAQNGLDKSGELADNIAEYSQLWAQAGFSAEEMFAIMENGLNSGAYNLDKVNDFVKEFGISLSDGRIEENINSFSAGTKNLFNQWKAGKATTKDVFRSVINDLANAKNQQEALTIASNTWSSLGEDNAMKVITSLNEVNENYENVQGTMEEIQDIKYDTLESRIASLGKTFQTEVAVPIAEKALPAIESGLDLVIDNMDTLIPLMGGVATGVVAFKTASAAVELFTTKTEGATVAQAAFNAIQNLNPVVAVATAVTAATAAIAIYANVAGEASEESQKMAEANQRVCDSANEVAESSKDLISSYADSNAEMQAQSEYAKTLAGNIEELAEKENLSNSEKSVMQQYVAQLNELVPGLNLAYDEQTNALSMTNEQIETYLSNSQKQIEMQAAQEYAIDLLKQKSELEIEAIKLENERTEIQGENGEKQISMMDRISALMFGLQSGNMDYYQSIKTVSEAQKENTEAMETNEEQQKNVQAEIEAASEKLQEYGINWSDVTQKANENTEATSTNAQAQTDAAAANAAAAQTIAETYTDMQQKVSEVIDSQMNMFEEFNAGTQLSSEQLLSNMQSQINGVTDWAENMEILADRGINQGILDKLAEMGPEGSNYVQAFAQMTDEQLKQANDLWSQSLDMKAGVNESVEGMIEAYTTAISGGKERVAQIMSDLGTDSVQGLVNGINNGSIDLTNSGKSMGDNLQKGAKDSLDSHSPSKAFERIGKDVIAGLKNGITDNKSVAVKAVRSVADTVEEEAEKGLKKDNFNSAGKNVASGIASGIKSGSSTVRRAVDSVCSEVKNTGLNRRTLYNEGKNVSEGLANGIRAGRSDVINAVARVCEAAVSEARRKLKIHSPSKVFEELGSYTAEGFGVGYQKQMNNVNGMIRSSMEIPNIGRTEAGTGSAEMAGTGKVIVELPIYVGKEYTRTEIVEIAMEGIAQRQSRYLGARGLRLSG